MIIAAIAGAVLVIGCQSSPGAADDAQLSPSPATDPAAFPAEHTATLWVMGIACPY